MSSAAVAARAQQRAFWLRMLHRWHWISSALSLAGLLLFSVTGITLNHAAQIPAQPQTVNVTAVRPEPLRLQLQALAARSEAVAPLPPALRAFTMSAFGLNPAQREAEWSESEIYLSLPRPGGDGWLAVDLDTGRVEYEHTDRGWIAWLNDLHKGRNTGPAWRWFIDVFALACLVFAITGLLLLQMHARQRGMTWPTLGLGLVLPLLIVILLIH